MSPLIYRGSLFILRFFRLGYSVLASYQDYIANGAGDPNGLLMSSLNGPAKTLVVFLIGAGVIMVFPLATSKKAYNIAKTYVDLARQDGGDEMFGSSGVARSLVHLFVLASTWIVSITPDGVRHWVNSRLNTDEGIMEDGAAFGLIRASINLV